MALQSRHPNTDEGDAHRRRRVVQASAVQVGKSDLFYTVQQLHLIKLTAIQQISNADAVTSQKLVLCQVKLFHHLWGTILLVNLLVKADVHTLCGAQRLVAGNTTAVNRHVASSGQPLRLIRCANQDNKCLKCQQHGM